MDAGELLTAEPVVGEQPVQGAIFMTFQKVTFMRDIHVALPIWGKVAEAISAAEKQSDAMELVAEVLALIYQEEQCVAQMKLVTDQEIARDGPDQIVLTVLLVPRACKIMV
jgi:hypothetical protein